MFFKGKINYPLTTLKSSIHGSGAFSVISIPARRKIGSIAGKIISIKEARRKVKGSSTIAIVELWNGKAIDATIYSNNLRYINHSCSPNTYMRTFNFHVEFYALRNIRPDEELTCNYGKTHHDGKKQCNCKSGNCKGFI